MNNKGFTLVELVVVIVIMAVLAGVMSVGIVSSTGKSDDEATILAISEALESSRYDAMTYRSGKDKSDGTFEFDDFYVEIKYEDDGYHIYEKTGSTKLNDKKLTNAKRVLYLNIGDTVHKGIDTLSIYYNKADGSFRQLALATIDDPDSSISDSYIYITTEQFRKKCILAVNTGRTLVE